MVIGDGGVGNGRAVGPGAGGFDLKAAAIGAGGIVGQGGALKGEPGAVDKNAAAAGIAAVALDGGAGNAGERATLLDSASVADRRVVKEEAVQDSERAQVVLVAEAAAGAAGGIVFYRAVIDG